MKSYGVVDPTYHPCLGKQVIVYPLIISSKDEIKSKYLDWQLLKPGAQLGNSKGGGNYICRKDEIMHGLSPSVKCAAPLLETCP